MLNVYFPCVLSCKKSFNIKTAVFEIATNILCIKNRTFQEFSKSGLDEFARDSQVRSPRFGVSLRWLRCSQFGQFCDGDGDGDGDDHDDGHNDEHQSATLLACLATSPAQWVPL